MGSKTFPAICILLSGVFAPCLSYGQTIPGSADAARAGTKTPNVIIPERKAAIATPKDSAQIAPDGAQGIKFMLKDLRFTGQTVLSEAELKSAYAGMIGTTISLDKAWVIAAQVTDKYRTEGYFLSRAYVPAQTIDDGILTIAVVEGFIEDVRVTSEQGGSRSQLLEKWIREIKSRKPLKTEDLESALLELNAAGGINYRAVLLPPKKTSGVDGAADLELVQEKSKGSGYVQADNYGSRFLGVHELRAGYSTSFLPDQTTSVGILTSVPLKQINNASIEHKYNFLPRLSLQLSGDYTRTAPGYTLKPQEIKGKSYGLGAALNYQWILHRDEQLSTKFAFDHNHSTSDILSSLLSEDETNVIRIGTHYAAYDVWQGYNDVNLTFSKGVDAFGGSKAGDLNLSRAEAVPDFSKLDLSYFRQQFIPGNIRLVYKLRGQWASDPLYSSEEFGYGGQDMGRSYDSSYIIGDKGLSTSLEAGYTGLSPLFGTFVTPYLFYDIGKVWNLDGSGQDKVQSASSAGGGIRFQNELSGISGGIGLAVPLTKSIDDPIYGSGKNSPRILLEIGRSF